jgi:cell filamentation protein
VRRSSRIIWRWAERDFGFRFCTGSGKRAAEYYQADQPNEFYHVSAGQRKFEKGRIEELSILLRPPTAPNVVANPWKDYGNADHQQITTPDGDLCLNWAGCLSKEEINERETLGVSRAKEFIADLALRDEPAPITLDLIRRIHTEMFGDIYPWAGEWRSVSLHKGDGPTRWPLPPFGMDPIMEQFAQDVLSRTPFLHDDDGEVLAFAAKFMGDYLTYHPFREGNGRSAFILTELIFLQNNLPPLDEYNRKQDQDRYFAACDHARLENYAPLTALLTEWQEEAAEALEKQLSEGGLS